MRNVGHTVDEQACGPIVTTTPQASWVDEMPTAEAIEARLWAQDEQQFSQTHERSLAYRYEPANDEERALVLRYFPDAAFALKSGDCIEVGHAGLSATADGGLYVAWDEVEGLTFHDSHFGNTLVVAHVDNGALGARSTKIKLRGLGSQEGDFKEAVAQYWQRHQVMRAEQAARSAAAVAAQPGP